MDNNNRYIWGKELISILVLSGIMISMLIVLSFSSSSLLEAWRMTFSHAHDMEVTFDEIRNLLVISTLFFLIVLGPIFLVIFLGGVGEFILEAKKIDKRYSLFSKLIFSIIEGTLIFLIFFAYIYFNFDHILSLSSLTVGQILSFLLKMILKIISIILIVKILIITICFSFRRIRGKLNSSL